MSTIDKELKKIARSLRKPISESDRMMNQALAKQAKELLNKKAQEQYKVNVNQQLLEALKKAESHLHAMMAHIDHKPQRFQEHCWQQVLDIRAAISAAQEGK